MNTKHPVGSLVRCREREWVVLPSADQDLLLLRPLGGSESEITGIYLPLNLDPVADAAFTLPNPAAAGDHTSGRLLRDAARLSFRSGAGPFRSLGRISVRPRPYQLVPLLMALRQEYARLLIADDVGIGKTIEAGLIARELLDRGEATGLAVVCPPHLCDQWRKELAEKFHIDAVVIRSGTVRQLDSPLPQSVSIFEHYRYQIVSIDYVKAESRRDAFLHHCPDLVIVDEAHTSARPKGKSAAQQQRHQLLVGLAQRPDRHLLLLTATPHSGVEESFLSLLGLLAERFGALDLDQLTERQRADLARHFVQRRRPDIRRWLGHETHFPERDPTDVVYTLSPEYEALYQDVFAFAREQVRSAETLSGFRQRVRYWAALALLRCVVSSPATARAALLERARGREEAPDDAADEHGFTAAVYDPLGEQESDDVTPAHVVGMGEMVMAGHEVKRLKALAERAQALYGTPDGKVEALAREVTGLLQAGYHPIVYCRYIATADYVAAELRQRLTPRWPDLQVIAVTGSLAEDEREARVEELAHGERRVLVATDCLSEGINLQHAFNAVIHYDLPWNPNRLEQREGRVDRFGQMAPRVRTIMMYGKNNPVDGAVLEVLLRKAHTIHKTLGITVPLPANSEDVMTALVKSLFHRAEAKRERVEYRQLTLFDLDDIDSVQALHRRWDQAAAKEKESRTRFAQHAIKPDEVAAELEETNRVLGDPQAVEHFVRAALERLSAPLERSSSGWRLNPTNLPRPVREALGAADKPLNIAFQAPALEGSVYVGRNHALTAGLAEYLLDQALDPGQLQPHAARCGVTRTDAVSGRTTLMLLRIRFLLERHQTAPVLAEECVVCGYRGMPGQLEWLTEAEALRLLAEAQPRENVALQQRQQMLTAAIQWLTDLEPELECLARERAERLLAAHARVRQVLVGRSDRSGRLRVQPQLPVDVLGLYVLMPVLKGVRG